MTTLKRLLVTTDYSDCSRAALEVATGLASAFGASIDLVHVWSAPYFGPGYGYDGAAIIDPAQHQSIFDLIRQRAEEDMKKFVSEVPVPTGVVVTSHVESGEPARKILELAERDRPDLIVIGTHGRTGPKRWLLGSVAERIVQHAPCPVLTVPPSAPR
jgi:nucleotide-binding universal stress UspA family protein